MTFTAHANPDTGHEYHHWDHFESVEEKDWPWPNFTPKEMACRLCSEVLIVPSFMRFMQMLRTEVGVPFTVTSGYRSPEHNAATSGTKSKDGPHVSGQAMDIAIAYSEAFELIALAMNNGAKGVGMRQHGRINGRYVHIDQWYKRDAPTLWTYDQSE